MHLDKNEQQQKLKQEKQTVTVHSAHEKFVLNSNKKSNHFLQRTIL